MTATTLLPRLDWLSRLRTIMVLRPGQRVVHVPGIGVSVSRRAVASAAADWWLVTGKTCVAAFQPKGAASLAASYVNLANPGTYDVAPGVAPTLAAGGWLGNGSAYLVLPLLIDARTYTILCRFASVNSNERLFGVVAANHFEVRPYYPATDHCEYRTGPAGTTLVAPRISTGVVGMAANNLYRNGASDGTGPLATAGATIQMYVLSAWTGTMPGGLRGTMNGGTIAALVVYSDTLTAPQVATVSAAMAAL